MDAKTWKRLKRVREDLDDLRDAYGNFGFGLIHSTLEEAVSLEAWQFVEHHVLKTHRSYVAPKERFPGIVDPLPDGATCLRWWGDTDAITAFKRWGDKAVGALQKGTSGLGDVRTEKRYFGTVQALCAAATGDSSLSSLVKKRTILDLRRAKIGAPARLPFSLARLEKPPRFTFLEVVLDGLAFADRVLEHLLESRHHLEIVPESCLAILDGTPYHLDTDTIAALSVLLDREEKLTSSKELAMLRPELEGMDIPRRILGEKFRKTARPIYDLIDRERGKGFRLSLRKRK
jgi:hypothetical protein